jgi:hypothetical protein
MVERIDNNGNYEPRNCKWIPKREQVRNMRTTKLNLNAAVAIVMLKIAGESTAQIAQAYNICPEHVRKVTAGECWYEAWYIATDGLFS